VRRGHAPMPPFSGYAPAAEGTSFSESMNTALCDF